MQPGTVQQLSSSALPQPPSGAPSSCRLKAATLLPSSTIGRWWVKCSVPPRVLQIFINACHSCGDVFNRKRVRVVKELALGASVERRAGSNPVVCNITNFSRRLQQHQFPRTFFSRGCALGGCALGRRSRCALHGLGGARDSLVVRGVWENEVSNSKKSPKRRELKFRGPTPQDSRLKQAED